MFTCTKCINIIYIVFQEYRLQSVYFDGVIGVQEVFYVLKDSFYIRDGVCWCPSNRCGIFERHLFICGTFERHLFYVLLIILLIAV